MVKVDAPFNIRKQIRIPEYDYSDEGIYFITICAYRKSCVFSGIREGDTFSPASVVLKPLGRLVEENIKLISQIYDSVNVLNSVIMPNHVHFLLEVRKGGEGDANRSKMLVPKIVQSFKAAVTRKAASKYGVIWQSRYYDHVVRDEQDLLRIWQYIDNNPARWLEDCYYTAYADR